MAKIDLYRDRAAVDGLLHRAAALRRTIGGDCRLMEVCGTHTMAVHRSGLKRRLEEAGIGLVAGPGCPVCITPDQVHAAALDLVSGRENLILAAFGDMTRVPTRLGSLQSAAPARGSSVRVVYSPVESLELARRNPDKEVVFFGAGFETTIPAIALTARRAAREGIANYSVLTALWIIPPPLRAILEAGDARISGFLYPGHVSAVIGPRAYGFVAEEFGLPGAIAGFEPADILLGVVSVLEQMAGGRPRVANVYGRAVAPDGNPLARTAMAEILTVKDAVWRGLGFIPASGLRLKDEYAGQDAERRYGLRLGGTEAELPGCRCGDVLKGIIEPPGCPLFGRACRPESPHGPCMVSTEGACLAFHKYGRMR